MAITATSRLCRSCGLLLPDPPAAAVCRNAECARVAVPLHSTWPAGFKKYLVRQMLERFWAPWSAFTEQYRWEQLVRTAVAGTQGPDRMIPTVAPLTDCYVEALRRFTAETATSSSSSTAHGHQDIAAA